MSAAHCTPPPRGRLPPAHGTPGERSLSPKALAYLNVRGGLITALATFVFCGTTVFLVAEPTWRAAIIALVAALALVSVAIELPWLNRREVLNTSYTVTPDFVYVTRGWLWRRSTVIATAQILNVEILQGPLLRAFGAVSVRFTCIADVERLGPLDRDAAELICVKVLHSHVEMTP